MLLLALAPGKSRTHATTVDAQLRMSLLASTVLAPAFGEPGNSVDVPAEVTMPTFAGAANVSSAPLKLSVVEALKLDVLEHDGRPERYPFFRAQVDEARTSGHYSDVKILQHLRGRLKGVSFDAVSGALLSGATLDDVLSVIRKRFGHPRVVVKSVIDSLLKRPRVRSGDVGDLITYSTQLDNAAAAAILGSVGYDYELDNMQSVQALVDKLPPHDVLRWGEFGTRREAKGLATTFSSFVSCLSGLVEERQYAQPTPLKCRALSTRARSDVRKRPSLRRSLERLLG